MSLSCSSFALRILSPAALAVVLLGSPVLAQNADAPMSLFERLFAPQQPVQQMAPAVQGADSYGYARRTIRRPTASRPRPKTRYVALQKSEPLKLRVADRQTPLDLKAGPAAAFMKDETLRPGDIVVMKDGMKVFVGRPDGHHVAGDFESIGRSDFVDRHTRMKLAAMTMPVGAMPAAEARKAMARVRIMPSSVVALSAGPLQVQAASMRVINPWTIAP